MGFTRFKRSKDLLFDENYMGLDMLGITNIIHEYPWMGSPIKQPEKKRDDRELSSHGSNSYLIYIYNITIHIYIYITLLVYDLWLLIFFWPELKLANMNQWPRLNQTAAVRIDHPTVARLKCRWRERNDVTKWKDPAFCSWENQL